MAGNLSSLVPNSFGIDSAAILDSILAAKQRPITAIENRIGEQETKKRAYLDISSRLLALQEVSRRLYDGSSFNSTVVRSSNESALLATGDTSSIEGTFQFYTRSLARTSQYVSNAFLDSTTQNVTNTAGQMTIEVGDARISRPTDLSRLNGSTGIDRGQIRITDDGGRVAIVDLTNTVSIQDVVDTINANGVAQVTARINDDNGSGLLGDGLIIENVSLAGNITVESVGTGQTAESLGIDGTSGTGTLIGTQINTVGEQTALSGLNDGRGIGTGSGTFGSLTITGSGAAMNVDITDAKTVGDVIDLINAAAGTVTASIAPDGKGLRLSDGGLPATITIAGTSEVLSGLGLQAATLLDQGGGDFDGRRMISSLGSVEMQSLGGVSGAGFTGSIATPSTFDITDSNGAITTVSFTGREDLYEILDQMNTGAASVFAQVDDTGTGIIVTDTAGGAGSLDITDTVGTVAAELGIDGTHADNVADAGNVNFKHIHGNRRLQDFGFDSDLVSGTVRITLKNGVQQDVDISNARSMGDVVNALNTIPNMNVAINGFGDGLSMTDTTGGTGAIVIEDVSGTLARRLSLTGTYSGGATITPRFEYTIDVDTNDSLGDVIDKIEGLDIPVTASIIDDGSGDRRFRLSVTGKEAGNKNDVVIRSDMAAFQMSQTSTASDAVLIYGSSEGTADPIVLRSADNSFRRVIPGITLDLLQASTDPITVSVTRDLQAVFNDITELKDSYNSLRQRMSDLAGFDTETLQGGPLLGDGTLINLRGAISGALLDIVEGLPVGANFVGSIGMDIDNDGLLSLDSDELLEALEQRIEDVRAIFDNAATLTSQTLFENWNNGAGLSETSGDDLRFTFRDGSADFLLDVSSYERLGQLIDGINADARLEAEISADGRSLVVRDLTTGASDFTITDENDSGTLSSLRFRSSTAVSGDDELRTFDINLNTQLGVARRIDTLAQEYTETNGLIDQATESIDDRISDFNDEIARLQERIQAERERLEKRFQAMDIALQDASATQKQLANSLKSVTGNDDN